MNHNDVLRRLRYALDLDDAQIAALFALGGAELTTDDARALLARQDDAGAVPCSDEQLTRFLDGLILDRRGPPKTAKRPPVEAELTNNAIFKKIRIALALREDQVLAMLDAGERPISKWELTAFFRKPTHRNYRPCGNQVLRAFLTGLTKSLRP